MDSRPDDGDSSTRAVMPLGDHLEELRRRILVGLAAFAIIFFLCLALGSQLFSLVRWPLEQAVEALEVTPAQAERLMRWNVLGPVDGFAALAKFSFYLSLAISLPVLLFQLWLFVSPGLEERERRAVRPVVQFASLMFLLGATVGFIYAAPVGLRWLFWFNNWLGVESAWTANNTIIFIQSVCIGFGLAFELPLVIMALGRLGIVTPQTLRRYRRHALLIIVVMGGLFTPPDPATQVMLAAILYGLYELGIILMRTGNGDKQNN